MRHNVDAARVKFDVIIVGKDRGDPILVSADDYLSRLQHYFPTRIVEVKEEPERRGRGAADVKKAEADRIQKVLAPDALVIALDERGRAQTSTKLAEKLGRWRDEGVKNVALIIGGPSGLDPELLRFARERWTLSAFTLPHRIARLVLLEQLYRAGTILRGEPYHRA